jgi:hypothetical protein
VPTAHSLVWVQRVLPNVVGKLQGDAENIRTCANTCPLLKREAAHCGVERSHCTMHPQATLHKTTLRNAWHGARAADVQRCHVFSRPGVAWYCAESRAGRKTTAGAPCTRARAHLPGSRLLVGMFSQTYSLDMAQGRTHVGADPCKSPDRVQAARGEHHNRMKRRPHCQSALPPAVRPPRHC